MLYCCDCKICVRSVITKHHILKHNILELPNALAVQHDAAAVDAAELLVLYVCL